MLITIWLEDMDKKTPWTVQIMKKPLKQKGGAYKVGRDPAWISHKFILWRQSDAEKSPLVCIHKRWAEMLKTDLNTTVFLPVSSTVRQMTPVFFRLNADLEIIIQMPAKHRLGDGE